MKGHDEHAAEDTHEEEHHEAVVTLAKEAQKAAGIEVQEAVPQALAAPIEATAVIELNSDRVAKISPRTSGRLAKLVAGTGRSRARRPGPGLLRQPRAGAGMGRVRQVRRGRVEVATEEPAAGGNPVSEEDLAGKGCDQGKAGAERSGSRPCFCHTRSSICSGSISISSITGMKGTSIL